MKNEIKEILDFWKRECIEKDLYFEINPEKSKSLYDYITNLQEKLKVSQTNEETYRLEMQDITKILGLDEHTTFDEVKEYATNLQEDLEKVSGSHFKIFQENKQLQQRCEYLERSNNRREDEIMSLRNECVDGETYKSRNKKANVLLDEMLERAYIDGEYIMYDYSTSELLEVKQALEGEDKDE